MLAKFLRQALDAGEPAVLVTVTGAQGSTPREAGAAMLVTANRIAGTIGGGSGGGVPRMLFRIHLPRSTGDVRIACDVKVRMLPCPSSPPRGLSAGNVTRRKWAPWTWGMS